MQKGRVLSLKRFSIFENLKTNTFLITITLLFTIGLLIGVFSQNDFLFLKNFSTEYIAEYISLRNAKGFGNIFLNSLLNFLREIFVLFLLGTSFFGIVMVPLVLLFKGIILGGATAYLYSTFSLKGIAFNAVIIIPPTLIFLIILFLCSRESVRFSIKLSCLTLPKGLPVNLSSDFKDYTVKYLILALGTIVCALIDAIISTGIIKYFTL